MQNTGNFESNDNASSTDTDNRDLTSEEEEPSLHDEQEEEEEVQEGSFPVHDLSQIVEVTGQRVKLTAARKKWRQWLREKCKDSLQDDALASKQKPRVDLVVKSINESPKSIWKRMVGAHDLITTTWLRREITSCHNKYYFMLFVGCFKLIDGT